MQVEEGLTASLSYNCLKTMKSCCMACLHNLCILSWLLFFSFAPQTRSDIKNGTILQLAISPVRTLLSLGINLYNIRVNIYHGPEFILETETIEIKTLFFTLTVCLGLNKYHTRPLSRVLAESCLGSCRNSEKGPSNSA